MSHGIGRRYFSALPLLVSLGCGEVEPAAPELPRAQQALRIKQPRGDGQSCEMASFDPLGHHHNTAEALGANDHGSVIALELPAP
jgi:hypothetical protein